MYYVTKIPFQIPNLLRFRHVCLYLAQSVPEEPKFFCPLGYLDQESAGPAHVIPDLVSQGPATTDHTDDDDDDAHMQREWAAEYGLPFIIVDETNSSI